MVLAFVEALIARVSVMASRASQPDRSYRWWQQAPRDVPVWSFWLMLTAIAIGVVLRVFQFTADTSLWLDELAIVNNLVERSFGSLLREPLGYAQVAPPGFVLIEKLMYELFGANDRALRLYSLVAGIGSLGAMALVSVRLGLREAVWVPPLLLALGGSFIFQSAQVKPYAGDVLLCLALVAVALRLAARSDAGRVWPAALGMLAPWFSFPAALTVAGVGAVLLASPQRRRLFPIVGLWAVSTLGAVAYANMLVHPDTAAGMQAFWSRGATGFPPGLTGLVPWIGAQLRAHLWSDVGLRGVTLWLGVAGLGALLLWRRNRFALAIVAAPGLAAVVAAALHRYPLGHRLSLFIAALLMVLIAVAAAEAARALQPFKLRSLAPMPAIVVAALPISTFAAQPPPYHVDHVKPVFAEIARARRPDDWLYVYPGAWHAYRYYGGLSGIAPEHVVFGRCPTTSLRESLPPLDAVRGDARVWVLFAHVTLPRDRQVVLSYLDRIGVRRQSVSVPGPAATGSSLVDAYLYDLSDPVRLRSTTWTTYPIARAEVPHEHSPCLFGMVPLGSGATLGTTVQR